MNTTRTITKKITDGKTAEDMEVLDDMGEAGAFVYVSQCRFYISCALRQVFSHVSFEDSWGGD